MTYRILSPRVAVAALALSLLGLVAVDSRPAEAVVCGPRGCVAGAPLARAAVAGPVGVGRVGVGRPGYGVGRPGVGVGGVGRNMGGPVNRVGRR
ncbi:hypothetical protein HNR60_001456 [Rhodopseudomonas rhenobacensis]|uniref:Uncharacterized protein n=1 Tax=Rhodopseudomonas rhenobacensis TaxID=87461 RepID=A0A7W7Z2J5_9BRAD|nr:hypothetical protein [Rhodopseudomonas rhenobacensis]MBB5046708.1 hypothetical protein [Rhodopseudomonas rhenobacensis]